MKLVFEFKTTKLHEAGFWSSSQSPSQDYMECRQEKVRK